jgi:phosphopantothenoylcysteine decarboxylase/phosphopantothenate--cysteine ligase
MSSPPTTSEAGPSPSGGGTGPLQGKRVVLGVCGGIAAYKAVEVCRRLTDAGALVSPLLTEGATRFIAPLTFTALAAEPARTTLFGPDGSGDPASPVPHVTLGRRADAVVVAPATARLIGSYAAGISSDLLTATLLATRAPVLVCPAMHVEMWEHPSVQDNVALLRRRGVEVLEPAEGRLAGGDVGKGRLPEAEEIVAAVVGMLARRANAGRSWASAGPSSASVGPSSASAGPASGPLDGVNAVVTAGGTREALDPVRYIANRSSGKQGYAVAAELIGRGAAVTLITSSPLVAPEPADVVRVESAAEMHQAVLAATAAADVVVMAAAVADYRPAVIADRKLKKTGGPMSLELVPTPDILTELCGRRRPGQVIVGFAAETASGAELSALGRAKLNAKGADLIVANEVGAAGAGFGEETSRAVIVSAQAEADLGVVAKSVVAARLADAIIDLLSRPAGPGTPQKGIDG